MDRKHDIEQSCNNLREIILKAKEPLIIKDQMQSDLISWSLNEWKELLRDELLQFRCGKNQYTEEPQWESMSLTKRATFDDFLQNINSNDAEWWYFDYKYLCQWFTDKEILKQKINWSTLGFPEIGSNESTIWMGSRGSHTSCHVDTYGCNIVLQVFGRKSWLLFPPEQNLRPTRIPFEESSIYSKLNFFSPNVQHFKGISRCHKIVLNPGEILVVPNRWWHYVENLETAISINTWVPLPQDEFQRIKESVATIFVRQLHSKYQDIILNPNMSEDMVSTDLALDLIQASTEKCKSSRKVQKVNEETSRTDGENSNTVELRKQFKNISTIPVLNETEFSAFLLSQSERFETPEPYNRSQKNDCKQVVDFFEVITSEDVLNLIAEKLIKKP